MAVKQKKKVNKLCKQWGINQISLNRFKVKGGNDAKRQLTHASDPQKGQEYMHGMWRHIRSASGNRNKAHLKRKSRSLWRQPKNSHVSPNVAEGFWRRCSSLKVNIERMQTVNQYGQTTGPDGGGRVLPRSGGYRRVVPPLSADCNDSAQRLMPGNNCSHCSGSWTAAFKRSSKLKDRKRLERIKLGSEFPQ